jgi:hypothetical protein
VNKLHYLSSTASIPGIFGPAARAAAPGQLQATYTVAGHPLEHHLRAAVKQKASTAPILAVYMGVQAPVLVYCLCHGQC